ncbi:hypothetical protein C8R43DRAFT_942617 [Mycena crocata]|nr:hypothetical protein C8R43DRAFT_942617 [Mycena crocata]
MARLGATGESLPRNKVYVLLFGTATFHEIDTLLLAFNNECGKWGVLVRHVIDVTLADRNDSTPTRTVHETSCLDKRTRARRPLPGTSASSPANRKCGYHIPALHAFSRGRLASQQDRYSEIQIIRARIPLGLVFTPLDAMPASDSLTEFDSSLPFEPIKYTYQLRSDYATKKREIALQDTCTRRSNAMQPWTPSFVYSHAQAENRSGVSVSRAIRRDSTRFGSQAAAGASLSRSAPFDSANARVETTPATR